MTGTPLVNSMNKWAQWCIITVTLFFTGFVSLFPCGLKFHSFKAICLVDCGHCSTPLLCPGFFICDVQVIGDSLALNSVAVKLRAARFQNGALSMDNIKLSYVMDKDGDPVGFSQYAQVRPRLVCFYSASFHHPRSSKIMT